MQLENLAGEIFVQPAGAIDSGGRVRFERRSSAHDVGTYPVVVASGTGTWLQAWTSGGPQSSVVRLSPLE